MVDHIQAEEVKRQVKEQLGRKQEVSYMAADQEAVHEGMSGYAKSNPADYWAEAVARMLLAKEGEPNPNDPSDYKQNAMTRIVRERLNLGLDGLAAKICKTIQDNNLLALHAEYFKKGFYGNLKPKQITPELLRKLAPNGEYDKLVGDTVRIQCKADMENLENYLNNIQNTAFRGKVREFLNTLKKGGVVSYSEWHKLTDELKKSYQETYSEEQKAAPKSPKQPDPLEKEEVRKLISDAFDSMAAVVIDASSKIRSMLNNSKTEEEAREKLKHMRESLTNWDKIGPDEFQKRVSDVRVVLDANPFAANRSSLNLKTQTAWKMFGLTKRQNQNPKQWEEWHESAEKLRGQQQPPQTGQQPPQPPQQTGQQQQTGSQPPKKIELDINTSTNEKANNMTRFTNKKPGAEEQQKQPQLYQKPNQK